MKFAQEISIFRPHAIELAVTALGTRITQTAEEIRLEAAQTLSNYSTTLEMNSAISQKADEITLEVSQTYATQAGVNSVTSQLSSRIAQTASSISFTLSKSGDRTASLSMTYTKENGSTVSLAAQSIEFTGLVRFNDLSTSGSTTINGANITTGYISAGRIAANSISVEKLTGTIKDSGNTWSINLNTGVLTVGEISAAKITSGTINAARIAANSIAVGKLTGSISNGGWKIDLTNGTLTIGEISAAKVTSGTMSGDRISAGTINGSTINGGKISQVVNNASHGNIWPSGSTFITQASIDNGIVSAAQYKLNGINILAEGDDTYSKKGAYIDGHFSTNGTLWCGQSDSFQGIIGSFRGKIEARDLLLKNYGDGQKWLTDELNDIWYWIQHNSGGGGSVDTSALWNAINDTRSELGLSVYT